MLGAFGGVGRHVGGVLALFMTLVLIVMTCTRTGLLAARLIMSLGRTNALCSVLPSSRHPLVAGLGVGKPVGKASIGYLQRVVKGRSGLNDCGLSIGRSFIDSSRAIRSGLGVLSLDRTDVIRNNSTCKAVLAKDPVSRAGTPLCSTGGAVNSCVFDKYTDLRGLVLPSSIRIVRDCTLTSYTSLVSVALPTSLVTVPGKVLHNYRSLRRFSIPSNISRVKSFTFGKANLGDFAFPRTVAMVAPVLSKTRGLRCVIVPSAIASVGSGNVAKTFTNLGTLGRLEVPRDIAKGLDSCVLDNYRSLRQLCVPDGTILA